MKFRVIRQPAPSGAHSPIYVIEQETGQGVGWINRYLDREYIRRLAYKSLYSYAHSLLHFVRWWEGVHHTHDISEADLTESTLLDYIRFQSSRQPPPSASTINDRVACADRAIRNEFPDAPCQGTPGFHQVYLHRRPLGLGRPRFDLTRLRVKEPRLTIVPLSVNEVARFWSSFRSARDLAVVGLMLMHGLRSAEVMALNRDDVLLSEGQLRVRGKGSKMRFLPLAPETTQLLDHYLRLERPDPCSAALFVVLKGPARGQRMTPAGLTLPVPTSPPHQRHKNRQPAPLPAHFRLGYGARRHQLACAHAVDGPRRYRDHSALCAGLSPGCLSSVCPRRGAVHPSSAEDHLVKRWRRPPLQHPLAPTFARAVASLSTALSPATERNYNIAVRSFLVYLGTEHRKITGLEQLRRDPHILGWMARGRAQTPPLATATSIGRLIALRAICNELAWTHKLTQLAHLIRREDIPRTPQSLPRPLTAEQDHLLQQELMRRNDLGGNVFLLLRHTGMRIGECVDLSYDCLHFVSPNQWAIHVPLGKLKTERMVPVDAFVRDLVYRLRFFRSLDPLADNRRLLAWHGSRVSLLARLRDYLHLACHSAGLPTTIVPHQLRHTYGTEMLRAGVGLAAVMKLLGHTDPGMTMRYVDVTLTDLQREFQLARSQPRHLAPLPKTLPAPPRTGHDGLIDSLLVAQNLMLVLRRTLPNGHARSRLDRLANRLTKILAELRSSKSSQ